MTARHPRLYVSSYRLGARAEVLRRERGRALVVLDALDEYPDRRRGWQREADDLAGLGYASEELDLREHRDAPPVLLAERLGRADLLWVVGGNAFVLARAATAACLAPALAATPGIVYAGCSAGACLASVDLAGIELMDDPATLPEGYRADMPATALGLLDTLVIPHAGTPDVDRARESLDARGLDRVELADGDDLLVGW